MAPERSRFEFVASHRLAGGGWSETYKSRVWPELCVIVQRRLPWTQVERVVFVNGTEVRWGDWNTVAVLLKASRRRRAA